MSDMLINVYGRRDKESRENRAHRAIESWYLDASGALRWREELYASAKQDRSCMVIELPRCHVPHVAGTSQKEKSVVDRPLKPETRTDGADTDGCDAQWLHYRCQLSRSHQGRHRMQTTTLSATWTR